MNIEGWKAWVDENYYPGYQAHGILNSLLEDWRAEHTVLRELIERLEIKTTHQQAQLAEIKRVLNRI